jgi:hemolysin D
MHELLYKYFSVFSVYWKNRKKNDVPKLKNVEAEFYPPNLALMHKGLTPLPHASVWIIIVLFICALLWSYFGKIDVTVSANGKVIPSSKTKIIQAISTANIIKINVHDGKHVKYGDILLELDATQIKTQIEQIKQQIVLNELQKLRSKAMIDAIDKNTTAHFEKPEHINDVNSQESLTLLLGMYQEYRTKILNTQAHIKEKAAEISAIHSQIRKKQNVIPNLRSEVNGYKELSDAGYIPKNDLMTKQNILSNEMGDLKISTQQLNQARASSEQAQINKKEIETQTKAYHLSLMNQSIDKLNSLNQELIKLNNQYQGYVITSPITGTVQQLSVNTIGGVVTTAQNLMAIVPENEPLEIEAQLANKDIGFIRKGQYAEIKIDTFQYTKYGTLKAQVLHISPDAVSDEKKGLVYNVKLKLEQPFIQFEQQKLAISPGMLASCEIKIHQRRLIEYFISPFKDHLASSLTER